MFCQPRVQVRTETQDVPLPGTLDAVQPEVATVLSPEHCLGRRQMLCISGIIHGHQGSVQLGRSHTASGKMSQGVHSENGVRPQRVACTNGTKPP